MFSLEFYISILPVSRKIILEVSLIFKDVTPPHYSKHKFHEQTKELIQMANENEPFHCKDVKMAETQIGKLKKELQDKLNKYNAIQKTTNKLIKSMKEVLTHFAVIRKLVMENSEIPSVKFLKIF